MTQVDASELGRLSEAITRLMPALDQFNQFDEQDLVARPTEAWMAMLDQPLPERGAGLDEVLGDLSEVVIPHGLRLGAPGFVGWVTTGPTTTGTVARLAATVAGGQRYLIHAFNHLEAVALRWLAELLGLPGDWVGLFTSGGSVANLVGLGAARQQACERIGTDPARDGLPSGIRWRVYASSEVHHVVNRAAGVLGLGRRAVASIAVGADQRIDVDRLHKALKSDRAEGVLPVAIVASAGTVNTGAIDPIEQLADLAQEYGVWLHVDGAYGLFGLLDPRVAPLYRGLERADSVAVDAHKWLATPVGCSTAYVRDRALLARAFTNEPADYLDAAMEEGGAQSPYDDLGVPYLHYGVEHSAPSRGVLVWAVLKEIGTRGVRERVVRHNDFARHLASRVEGDDRLELLAAPTLSICCFRYRVPQMGAEGLDDLNAEIVRRLHIEGKHVPTTTRVAGRLAIRPCYINPRTTLAEVDDLADRVRGLGDSLATA